MDHTTAKQANATTKHPTETHEYCLDRCEQAAERNPQGGAVCDCGHAQHGGICGHRDPEDGDLCDCDQGSDDNDGGAS